ncbi:acyltransferase [Desulfovibrio sp. X2]|uniref:acyltransferase family protein n=1 Tax=Desulfovibrio sp. X2 TaxID=941449 RepID=UPI0022872741|nr:acyltransferase [Desulfovibrio sp. X2]
MQKATTFLYSAFYKSRALRLFPVYYVGILISLSISYHAVVSLWHVLPGNLKFYFVFQNLFIFGQDLSFLLTPYPFAMSLNLPAWTLAVEMGFYFVAPFIVKEPKRLVFFVLFGCIYLISIMYLNYPTDAIGIFYPGKLLQFNYNFYASSFVFFGGGALAYHLSKGNLNVNYLILLLIVFLLSFTKTEMPFWHLLFVCLAIPPLFSITASNRVDRIIGELSYPVYILHFPILQYIKPLTKTHPQYFGIMTLGSYVAIISCVLGLFLYFFLEKKINRYRHSKVFLKESGFVRKRTVQVLVAGLLAVYFIFPMASVAYIYKNQGPSPLDHAKAASDLTDATWVNGVAREFTGFSVQDSRQNLEYFTPGKVVRFANGITRKIVEAKESGEYLSVFVEGEPLDGKRVGFPHEIEVLE